MRGIKLTSFGSSAVLDPLDWPHRSLTQVIRVTSMIIGCHLLCGLPLEDDERCTFHLHSLIFADIGGKTGWEGSIPRLWRTSTFHRAWINLHHSLVSSQAPSACQICPTISIWVAFCVPIFPYTLFSLYPHTLVLLLHGSSYRLWLFL